MSAPAPERTPVRWWPVWLVWLALAACAPVGAPQPQASPPVTPAPLSTQTPAATATTTPTQAPLPTATPAAVLLPTSAPSATSSASAACTERQGRLSVSSLDSAALHRRAAYQIYLPPCYDADPTRLYPVLYLLHGAGADDTQWPDLNVAPDADGLIAQRAVAPFIVVMPDGDYQGGEDYAAFVLRDLVPGIEQTVRAARDRKDRAIGGISRGGAWALQIALTHPELFSAVGGHSPVSGEALPPLAASAQDPVRIYLDVGSDDPLVQGVEAFANMLRAHGFAPLYHVYPGAHNRTYWRAHTAEYLAFYAAGW